MKSLFVILSAIAVLGLSSCDQGDKVASAPNGTDCVAYGNCANAFPNGVYNGNFYPYNVGPGGNAYYQGGFSGCSNYQYPVYYPNYGYACVNHSAFNTGINYGVLNYRPASYEFRAQSGWNFPTYYNYNLQYVYQGCSIGYGSCNCQPLTGVTNNFGICAGTSIGWY